ncbi:MULTISPECIES: D-2-hydroxyacid dehydrogenase [unclassified Paenibacillus]|uniref:D-2-hydroxyacid dehydrogenase n=1 Tax=unclassified Paenibacillus TaxID=185978 RepID=UPI00071077DE|nr:MULTISPECIES: D-2-hydroxyacid dehydrogenase [unclassified Paenibacillus]KQX52029.1 glycerate dehydrogenase [Paenibacillus sp. Root444D2]KRE50947.1 glycerate dehydrogenase [Paenibacillus sp. Soil724D2]
MQIVVLDGYTLNPGDLNWSGLDSLGELVVYDRTAESQIIERAADAEIVLTNKTPLSAQMIQQLPKLRYIGVLATGYNIVDIHAAKEKGIIVANVPAYSTHSVAQLVFALLLEFCHRVQQHSDSVLNGDWSESIDFSYSRSPLVELNGQTMGLIGLGQIGKQTALIAQAMGMKVIATGSGRNVPQPIEGIEWVQLDELLQRSDVISLHCPLTPETNQLIDANRIAQMKPTAILINTARGGLLNEEDVAHALNEGRLAGAGLDVLTVEPPRPDNPLLHASNVIITPHIAWATKEARARLMDTAVGNVRAYQDGRPVNVVG